MLPPSKACLYGHTNMTIITAWQQPISRFSQSYSGGKARSKTGFWFNVYKRPELDSGSTPYKRSFTLKLIIRMAGSHVVMDLAV